MADGLYDFGRESFAGGNNDWDTDDIRVILVDTDDYTVDLAVHDYLDDVAGASRVATSGAITTPTIADGVCADHRPWKAGSPPGAGG